MTAYEIEKGLPLAPRASARKRRYPIREMKKGDSFLVPTKEVTRNLGQSVRNVSAYYGFKVACRKIETGIRVWRIS